MKASLYRAGLIAIAAAAISVSPICAVSVQAQVSGAVEQSTALTRPVRVSIAPGRVTAVSFQTQEIITSVMLGDASQVVYTLNGQPGSQGTTTLFLRQIQRLTFPGALTTDTTNLVVQTVDPTTQEQRLYNFDLSLNSSASVTQTRVTIVPAIAGRQTVPVRGITPLASIADIERGLEVAINRGYTAADDPIVAAVRQVLGTVQANNIPMERAAAQADVPMEILHELGRMGQTDRLLHPSEPEPPEAAPETVPSESTPLPSTPVIEASSDV